MICIGCCPIKGTWKVFLLSGRLKRMELILRYDIFLNIKENIWYIPIIDDPPHTLPISYQFLFIDRLLVYLLFEFVRKILCWWGIVVEVHLAGGFLVRKFSWNSISLYWNMIFRDSLQGYGASWENLCLNLMGAVGYIYIRIWDYINLSFP